MADPAVLDPAPAIVPDGARARTLVLVAVVVVTVVLAALIAVGVGIVAGPQTIRPPDVPAIASPGPGGPAESIPAAPPSAEPFPS